MKPQPFMNAHAARFRLALVRRQSPVVAAANPSHCRCAGSRKMARKPAKLSPEQLSQPID
jgi:hypothetical protein